MRIKRFGSMLVATLACLTVVLGAQAQNGYRLDRGSAPQSAPAPGDNGGYDSSANQYQQTPSSGQSAQASSSTQSSMPPTAPSFTPNQNSRPQQWVDAFSTPTQPPASSPNSNGSAGSINSYGSANSTNSFGATNQASFSNPYAQGGSSPQFQQQATQVRIKPKALRVPEKVPEGGITVRELQVLSQHDVAIVVDRSLSMTTRDCPAISSMMGGWQGALAGIVGAGMGMGMGRGMGYGMGSMNGNISRWDFVQSQTMALAKQTGEVFPNGITLVLFSTRYNVFKNVDLRQIPMIFSENRPGGSTNTADAVQVPIEDYLSRRQATGGRVKPLVIAVVTDGMPSNFDALRRLLIETTQQLRNPHEIRVTFLQIGTERKGFEFLRELDDGLVSEGAKFDIVDSKMFPEVVKVGLARSLVDAIEERHGR